VARRWANVNDFRLDAILAGQPTAEVIHDTHPYSMPPEAIGSPARSISIGIACAWWRAPSRVTHERKFQPGDGSILPEHRAQHVAAVSGTRAKRYVQREHLLKLGPEALAYLTELTHRRPQVWLRDIDRLHALLAHNDMISIDSNGRREPVCGLAHCICGPQGYRHELISGTRTREAKTP
jgi:hypothetical protein